MNKGSTKIAGTILAGGKATRYANRPKGLLRLPSGETIIERLLRVMTDAGVGPLTISANDPALYAHFGATIIPDLTKGKGPVGGIEAALSRFKDSVEWGDRADAVLFLPCDTPNITADEVRELCDEYRNSESDIVFAETADGTLHPLCCVVNVTMAEKITEAARSGRLAVWRLWAEFDATSARFEHSERFANVNVLGEFDDIVGAPEKRDDLDQKG